MLPEKAARRFAGYVREGGALVAEARAGWNNERGYAAEATPGMGLDAVFGCKETDVQSVAGGRATLVWASSEIPGLVAGDRVAGRIYEETLQPHSGGRVVARFASGAPAAVVSSYGRGKALALGSYIGAAYEAHRDEGARKLFGGLLQWAGVRNPVSATAGAEVRLLRSGGDTLAFVFNHRPESVESEIELRLPGARARASDIVTGEAVLLRPAQDGVRLAAKLSPGQVWVIRLH